MPTEGSYCLLLSGDFGRSPFSWQHAERYWTPYSFQ